MDDFRCQPEATQDAPCAGAALQKRIRLDGFTLVELMVSFAIFIVILGSILSIMDGVRKAWERGEYQVDVCQNGRAILGLFQQDLRPAIVSDLEARGAYMQFTQDAPNNGIAGEASVKNSNSLYWWTPSQTPGTEFYENGWFLNTGTAANTSATDTFRLRRFNFAMTHNASIFTSVPATKYYQANRWLGAVVTGTLSAKSTVVSNGTIGLWIQCLDPNGNPIPPLKADTLYNNVGSPSILTFDSSAYFQMAPRGSCFGDPAASPQTTFQYTAPVITDMANALPDSVRVVIMLTDEATMKRSRDVIVNNPFPTSMPPMDLDAINQYANDLSNKKVQTRIFSTTIKLPNALK